jgi:hypothetical protein
VSRKVNPASFEPGDKHKSSGELPQNENNYFTEMYSGPEAGSFFKAHILCVALKRRRNKEEKKHPLSLRLDL